MVWKESLICEKAHHLHYKKMGNPLNMKVYNDYDIWPTEMGKWIVCINCCNICGCNIKRILYTFFYLNWGCTCSKSVTSTNDHIRSILHIQYGKSKNQIWSFIYCSYSKCETFLIFLIRFVQTIVVYPTPHIVTCTLRIWLREIGFALAYGALMLKTWR